MTTRTISFRRLSDSYRPVKFRRPWSTKTERSVPFIPPLSLLDLCWNHLEVSSILNNHDLGEAKNDDCTEENDQHEPGLDTLKLAIRYQVKGSMDQDQVPKRAKLDQPGPSRIGKQSVNF